MCSSLTSQPTHLDLESITAVNNGVADFKGNVLFASHDHEFMNTIANRIIELREDGVLDKECFMMNFWNSVHSITRSCKQFR